METKSYVYTIHLDNIDQPIWAGFLMGGIKRRAEKFDQKYPQQVTIRRWDMDKEGVKEKAYSWLAGFELLAELGQSSSPEYNYWLLIRSFKAGLKDFYRWSM